MSPWLLAAPLAVAILAAVFFWRQTLNLKEALAKAINTDNAQVVRDLKAQVDLIPARIAEAEQKAAAEAVEAYIAANPPTVANLDGLTRDDVIELIRTLEEDQRNINTQGDAIDLFFENNRVHGNPYWPNEGPV